MTKADGKKSNDVSMTIRLPKELRDRAQIKADANAQSLSELIRRYLQSYVDEK
jgi:predicted HicB family RNase H-like nuclease